MSAALPHQDIVAGLADLPPVRLFQAPDQVLDLQTLDPDDAVAISVLAPMVQTGDQIVVQFGSVQSEPYTVTNPALLIFDVLLQRDKLPPLGADYAVTYSINGGASAPPVTVRLTDTSLGIFAPRRHQRSLYGYYEPGVLATWLVPTPYQLAKGPVLVRTGVGKEPSAALTLPIVKEGNPSTQIGSIVYDPHAASPWQASIFQNTDLHSGDRLSVQLPSEGAQFLNVAFSL